MKRGGTAGCTQAHVLGKGLAEADVVALLQEHAWRPGVPLAVPGGKALVPALDVPTDFSIYCADPVIDSKATRLHCSFNNKQQ